MGAGTLFSVVLAGNGDLLTCGDNRFVFGAPGSVERNMGGGGREVLMFDPYPRASSDVLIAELVRVPTRTHARTHALTHTRARAKLLAAFVEITVYSKGQLGRSAEGEEGLTFARTDGPVGRETVTHVSVGHFHALALTGRLHVG